jgi:hypothetical protein
VQNFLLEDVPSLDRFLAESGLRRCTTAELQFCGPRSMRKTVNSVLHNPATRVIILIALIIPISVYPSTGPVRRGFMYYTGVFAPSYGAAIAGGPWTWNWKWLWLILVACSSALTILIQTFMYMLG